MHCEFKIIQVQGLPLTETTTELQAPLYVAGLCAAANAAPGFCHAEALHESSDP